jgi:hypothetical protein
MSEVKVNFNGTMLLCDVDYQPFEAATHFDPEVPEDVEVTTAFYVDDKGRTCDVLELIASWCDVESFKESVLEAIHAEQD